MNVYSVTSSLPPYAEYVYGTPRAADLYFRRTGVSLELVDDSLLCGYCVRQESPAGEFIGFIPARNLPAWTRY